MEKKRVGRDDKEKEKGSTLGRMCAHLEERGLERLLSNAFPGEVPLHVVVVDDQLFAAAVNNLLRQQQMMQLAVWELKLARIQRDQEKTERGDRRTEG
eukprot:1814961-Pleurochrysis_carterae.AAC.5